MPKTNKLTVYLLRKTILTEGQAVEFSPPMKRVNLNGTGVLYYTPSESSPPAWLSNFFLDDPRIDSDELSYSGISAVLIIPIVRAKSKRYFAIAFGTGRFLLKDGVIEENFGLITALNLLGADKIRGMTRRTLATNPKSIQEQVSRSGPVVDFGVDFERDLVQGITGNTTNDTFGKTVTGKDAFSFNAKVDRSNISNYLGKLLTIYRKKDYKTNFGWIDQIKEVKDLAITTELEKSLITGINNGDTNIWLSVPDIIDWTDVVGFKYSAKTSDEYCNDLEISGLLNYLREAFEQKHLSHTLTCWKAGGEEDEICHRWSVLKCLNAEIDHKKEKYVLANGRWYMIAKNFVNEVENDLQNVNPLSILLPDYDHDSENDYNNELAKQLKGECLDANNLYYGGGQSKIEFCDVVTKKYQLFHVKKYGGSSVLSHLFNQGYVSAELLVMDARFREKLKSTVLPKGYHLIAPDSKPKSSNYSIVFVIIKKPGKKVTNLPIPFFSKVALRRSVRALTAYGFNVFLNTVQNKRD